MGNSLVGLTYYSNNEDDPYITLKEEVCCIGTLYIALALQNMHICDCMIKNQPFHTNTEFYSTALAYSLITMLCSVYQMANVLF